jgi:hypothetical protein
MSNSSFDNWAKNIRGWPWNLLGLFVISVLFLISVGLFYEDFTTSLRGYELWPTAKANAWVVFLVALLPQFGQLGMSYAFMDRKIDALFIFLLLFMGWDIFMDVYFKSFQFQSIELSAMAIFESITLYTIGSELLLAFTLGMLFRLIPSVLQSRSYTPNRQVFSPTYKPNTGKVNVPPKHP